MRATDVESHVGETGHRVVKKISWVRMMAIAFVSTSAGPFGLEVIVKSGGPLCAIIFIFLIPLIHVIPPIFITTELSAWMPSNHGCQRWVDKAFGHFAGFMVAFVNNMQNVIDSAVYPVLCCDYLSAQFYPGMPRGYRTLLQCAFVIIGSAPALIAASDTGIVSGTLGVLICIPFLIGAFAGLPTISPHSWTGVATEIEFGPLLASGLWMYTGFFALGYLGGEVEDHTVFIKGCTGAMILGIVTYSFPLMVILQVHGEWEDGFLVTAFDRILPGLGVGISIGGAVSAMALFIGSMLTSSRSVWAMADRGWFPRFFAKSSRTGSPYVAVCLLMVTSVLLGQFDLGFLVTMELQTGAIVFLLYYVSFVALRYQCPHAARPYTFPGGKNVAMLMVSPVIVVLFMLFASNLSNWKIDFGVGIVVTMTGLLYYFVARHSQNNLDDEEGSLQSQE